LGVAGLARLVCRDVFRFPRLSRQDWPLELERAGWGGIVGRMKGAELLELAERVLRIPTAPYHEQGVRALVEELGREWGLRVARDRAGNVIVRAGTGRRPLVFVAHMDHPGFEALGGKSVVFFGGVPAEMFPGARVRFGAKVAQVRRVTGSKRMQMNVTLPRGTWGMWDVPAFAVRRGRLQAAAVDDLVGVSAILAMLRTVAQRKQGGPVWGVFTRAEEVGFHGALEMARAGVIPRAALVVSVEMSRARAWARIGAGPVVRVGDRLTTFDPRGTMFLQETALAAGVKVQRALMDGGSCEATAFAAHGYRTAGLCLPLGNYHNIGPGQKPRAEYVSVADFEGLVEVMVAAVRRWPRFNRTGQPLLQRLRAIRAAAPRPLWRE